jgi:hypothetical protein
MAAETLTGTRAADGFPVAGHGFAGNLKVAYGSYAVAANVEDGDIFELCKLPAGAVVLGGAFYSGDLDTGTETLDIDVGWAANGTESADPDGFVNSGVLTGDAITDLLAAGSNYRPFPMATGPLTFTNETIVQAEANAASAAFAAGTIYVVVYYVLP